MSEIREVRVPDVGDAGEVEVIEVLVSPGDHVEQDQGLITLESDKASMDVPAPEAGTVQEMQVEVGDQVSHGTVICTLETEADQADEAEQEPKEQEAERQEHEADDDEARGEEEEAAAEGPEEDGGTGERKAARDRRSGTRVRVEERAPDPSESDYHAQVVVLGAGPGGYTAAFRAADLGLETLLVERHPTLGGVCLNVGCIPSKALLHAARVIDEVEAFRDHGLSFGEPEIDLDRLREWKDGVVGKLTGGLSRLAKRRKVKVVHGTARLINPWQLEVEGEDRTERVGFDHLILAAGSRVIELPVFPWDDPRVMDSTDALELEEIPERLLVVGGGIIGLEMATVYDALGSRVSVVELTDGLMPGTDRDLVKPLHKRIAERYENIWLGTEVVGAEAGDDGIRVTFEGDEAPEPQTFDRILVAVGRRPNGDCIGAEAAGLQVDGKGFVPTDKQQRTNVHHIFAIGDLTGPPLLAHKASHEGKVAAEVAAGHDSAFDARAVPSVAYTDPEVAWIGPTEEELQEEGRSYGKGTFPWAANGRSLGTGRSEGMTKILFDDDTGRVIGAGIVGTHAGDLISELTLALEMGADAADISLTIHPHPTLSETVAMAAEAFEGTLTELYKPKRRS